MAEHTPMCDAADTLRYAVQYRKKEDGVYWRTMATFDVQGPAERYFNFQDFGEECPYEYRLFDLRAGKPFELSAPASSEPR